MSDEQQMQNDKRVPTKTTRMGIVGLIIAIIACICAFFPIANIIGLILGIIAFIMCIVALVATFRRRRKGRVLSVIAILIAIAAIVISLLTLLVFAEVVDETASEPVGVVDTSGNEQTGSNVDYKNLSVGETVEFDNGLKVSVDKVSQTTVDNKDYTCVTVTYENTSNDTLNCGLLDWRGLDSNDNPSEPYLSGDDKEFDDYFVDEDLGSNDKLTGNIYFEKEPEKVSYYSNLVVEEADWDLSK